ncbi:MAG: hypothetical protein H0U52_01845 [Chloroflexi bacterium]|nr:hypothetical protein [Chloroflexota bacterium]
MATTDARAGFRLPWSSERQSTDHVGESADRDVAAATGWPSEDTAQQDAASPDAAVATIAEAPATDTGPGQAQPDRGPVEPAAPKPPTGKKPSKFMADLTKAMQAAAEDARTRALAQLQSDAKTHVEAIHGRSATDAAGLRRKADDDVATVREWSKAEIARIREETETKITERKAGLETQIEQHAAVIEREIDAVQKTVAAFEEAMAAFFERLLGEEDPSRFATLAENLPEPPSFDGLLAGASDEDEGEAAVANATVVEVVEVVEAEGATLESNPGGADDTTLDGDVDETEPGPNGELDRESAFAAIQATAQAAANAEDAADPRFAALGLSPDYDAAEAEALADAGDSDEEIPEIGDDALAARIAGLVPGKGKTDEAATSTQVVVVGLVSVASIASFKRHLGRLTGVQSVGVSSGPEGEFIFAVSHGADVVVPDAIPSLPSFQARVTGSADGIVHVTAHDPESDA